MLAARLMPFTKPRHAFATSKLMAELGSPRPWCRRTATDGSRCLRVTEVLMSRPTSDGCDPGLGQGALSRRRPWRRRTIRRAPSCGVRARRRRAASSPLGSFSRARAPARRSSMSPDVVTRLGRALATDNRDTLSKRVVAFPATKPPSNETVGLVSSRVQLYARCGTGSQPSGLDALRCPLLAGVPPCHLRVGIRRRAPDRVRCPSIQVRRRDRRV